MLDRTIAPKFREIDCASFPWPQLHMLQNQVPLYVLHMPNQAVTKIELLFKSGSYYEKYPGVAYFTAAMLQKGTHSKEAQAIAHIMDYYGATISMHAQVDFCSVQLATLTKHLEPMVALLMELLLTPSFPKKSLQLLKEVKIHSLQMEDTQIHKVAYKAFRASIFTPAHAYGRYLTVQDVHSIALADLHHHYEQLFFSDCCAFVSGQVSAQALPWIKQALEQLKQQKEPSPHPITAGAMGAKIHTVQGKQLQSAIVIGKKLCIQKNDPDFIPMMVVNELLGGYFGSRLVQNIREDKGYTYGISSCITLLQKAAYWAITTEVAQSVTWDAIQEIYKEIKKLQHELVSEDELMKVKHYLLGRFLTTMDDPFSVMQCFQAAYLYGLDQDYYATCYRRVRSMTALEIRNLTQKYLSSDTLTEVVIG